ncbi:DoxX family protein [Amycolatopsis nigrescens]|uniref:DoxX family protein n=1 Tax=Amycolatopsis nigrescens TaxID=381445 RepID=UPI00036961B5|nr:DoxX family protein [Amycolatopsis nigrescens]
MSIHDEESKNRGMFDDTASSTAQTTVIPDLGAEPDERADTPTRWHGGLDFGLLVLRVVLGGTMGAHGLQKIFGLFNGPGIDGFAKVLEGYGFTSQTTLLSWVTGLTEIGGGGLLVLGLFTPLGAAGILGLTSSIVYVKAHTGFFNGAGVGFEYELLLGTVALVLLFTGSGRLALDVNTPWRRKPLGFGIFGFLLAAAAAVLVLVLFR